MSIKKRKTNVELLRIIAMLMIIASHMAIYGIFENPIYRESGVWESASSLNKIISVLCVPGGDIGVGIFFIITGFFINRKTGTFSIRKIVYAVFFYGLFNIAVCIISKNIHQISDAKEIVLYLIAPISGNIWWFITVYIIVLLLAPTINSWLSKQSKRKILIAVIVFWMMWCCAGKILGTQYNSVCRGIWFYLIGAYLSRCSLKNKNKKIYIFIFIILWGMYAGCTYIVGVGNRLPEMMINAAKFLRITTIAPVASIVLFIIFNSIKIPDSYSINKIASYCLGIYLFHESPTMRDFLWNKFFHIGIFYQSDFFWIIVCSSILAVFLAGCLIECLREKILKLKAKN